MELISGIIGALIGSLVSSVIAIIGWNRSNNLIKETNKEEYRKKQIDEFYGPLLGLIKYSQVIYDIAELKLPTKNNHIDFNAFDKSDNQIEHSRIWDYLNDNYFVDINAKIADLLNKKQYYAESEELKKMIKLFIMHEAQGNCLHRLWRDLKEPSDNIKNGGFPEGFEKCVEDDLIFIENEYKRLAKI